MIVCHGWPCTSSCREGIIYELFTCMSFSCGELKYKICGNWPRVGFVPLKLKEHEVKLNIVPSGPINYKKKICKMHENKKITWEMMSNHCVLDTMDRFLQFCPKIRKPFFILNKWNMRQYAKKSKFWFEMVKTSNWVKIDIFKSKFYWFRRKQMPYNFLTKFGNSGS